MLSLLKLCSLPCMHLIQPQHLPSSELDLERSRLVKTPWRLLSPLFHLLDELLPNCGPRIRPTYECYVFHSRNYCYYSYIGTSLRMTWKAIELFFLSLFVNCILQIKCSVSCCKGYRRACVFKGTVRHKFQKLLSLEYNQSRSHLVCCARSALWIAFDSTAISPSRNHDPVPQDNTKTLLWAVSCQNCFLSTELHPPVSLHRRKRASTHEQRQGGM